MSHSAEHDLEKGNNSLDGVADLRDVRTITVDRIDKDLVLFRHY